MRKLTSFCAVLCAFGLASSAFAGEKTSPTQKRWEGERKEAEAEEQREAELTFEEKAKMRAQYRGILALQDGLDDGNPDVIGSFTAEDAGGSRIYMLKIENKELIRMLKTLDRKKVALSGKVRNGGKYLLVTGVTDQSGGPPRNRRRAQGGL